jgi:hypothetical protein
MKAALSAAAEAPALGAVLPLPEAPAKAPICMILRLSPEQIIE